MRSNRGGYTIIEVLMVLAVSGVMMFTAVSLFSGKQSETQFSQAMQELDSKIRATVNDVGVSVFPQSDNYTCTTNASDIPSLTAGASGTGSNQDCIYVGKALRFNIGANNMQIYTVIGNRTYDAGGGQRRPVTSLSNVNKAVATQISETYNFSFRYAFVDSVWLNNDSACPPPANNCPDMMGFYNSLQTSSNPAQQGSQSLFVEAYRVPGAVLPDQCIDGTTNCNPTTPSKWTLCFKSDDSKNTATIIVNNTPAGVKTELQFKPDPVTCS